MHTDIHIQIHINIYRQIYTHIYIWEYRDIYLQYLHTYITVKNYSNNVDDTMDNSSSKNNARKWYCPKETLFVLCKSYIICMVIQRVTNSLFLVWWRFSDCTNSTGTESHISGPKTITIQYHAKQSALDNCQQYGFN